MLPRPSRVSLAAPLLAALIGVGDARADFMGRIDGDNSMGPAPACLNQSFRYDTENGLGGTVISQACAQMLALGTLNADGTFTAPAGTPMSNPNNGAYHFWEFSNITVTVTDSNGNACAVKQDIRVARDQVGADKVVAGLNVLNQVWINSAGACLGGAGAAAKGFWNPGWTPPAPPKKADAGSSTDPTTGYVHQTVPFTAGSGLATVTVPMIYQSLSDFTFIPQSVAAALGLVPSGSIDLSLSHQGTLDALDFDGLRNDGQTVYQTAFLPLLSAGLGDAQSGMVLIADDANSSFGVLGGAFATIFGYANGAGTGGNDLLFTPGPVPEPASLALVLCGFASLALVHRGRSRRRA
jgi:hypothetical protein